MTNDSQSESGGVVSSTALLACPFCGAIPKSPEDISEPDYAGKWWKVQCPKCGAWRSGGTPAEASAKWNMRAQSVGRWESDVMLGDVKRLNWLNETPCLLGITDSGEWQIATQTKPRFVVRGATVRDAIDAMQARFSARISRLENKWKK